MVANTEALRLKVSPVHCKHIQKIQARFEMHQKSIEIILTVQKMSLKTSKMSDGEQQSYQVKMF